MIPTAQLRYVSQETVTRTSDRCRTVVPSVTLEQWFDPEILRGELVGEWRAVPIVEGVIKIMGEAP